MNHETAGPPPPPLHLAYLADHPEHLSTVARWLHDEFGPQYAIGDALEVWEGRLREQMQREAIPLNVVALEAGRQGPVPVGTAALVEHRSEGLRYYAPRLAFLFVPPEHRGRGLGAALTRRVEAEAARLGHSRLYLYATDAEGLYARLGWRVLERLPWKDGTAAAMTIDVTAASGRPA